MRPLSVERFAAISDVATDLTPVRATEAAARALRVSLQVLSVHGVDDIDNPFTLAAKGRAQAVIVLPSPMMFFHRTQFASQALSRRLAMIAPVREYVEAGGLMSYGPNIMAIFSACSRLRRQDPQRHQTR
jgi:putative tryptophan/tyrosine transport system substrate-binding protein